MPDISMCEGGGCPLKENCYRFTATPSLYGQAYFLGIPYNQESKSCEYFWKNKEDETKTAI